MNYFVDANTSPTPPRVHPLLLSLALMFNESETSLNMRAVSEDNSKVLSSNYYTSPKDLPLLDIHLPGQNASCGKCMAPKLQEGSAMVSNVAMSILLAASILESMAPEPQDDSTEVDHSIVTIPSNGKKQQCAAGGSLQNVLRNKIAAKEIVTRLAEKQKAADDCTKAITGTMPKRQDNGNVLHDTPNTCSSKVARLRDKAKGKMDKHTNPPKGDGPNVRDEGKQSKTVFIKDKPSPQEKNADESREEGNELAMSCEDNDSVVRDLEKEVHALKSRCEGQDKMIEDLKSRCEIHERVLEMLWQEIVQLHDSQKTLNTMYDGKSYDFMP
ncbi:hypothetical protein H4582DRAFT_2063481 [Lactarius indigo]|nr:hypothetical protein H4582DRAFT_2063481 [Lactarius indigo]